MSNLPPYPYGPEENPLGNQNSPTGNMYGNWNEQAAPRGLVSGNGSLNFSGTIKYAFKSVFRSDAVWILIGLLFMAVSMFIGTVTSFVPLGLQIASGVDDPTPSTSVIVAQVIMTIISSFISVVLQVFLWRAAFHQVIGQQPTFRKLFNTDGLAIPIKISIIQALLSLVIAVPMQMLQLGNVNYDFGNFGGAAIIIAVLVFWILSIFLYPLFVFWLPASFDQSATVGESIRKGFRLGLQNYFPVLGFSIVFGLLMMLVLLFTCGIGSIFVVSLSPIAFCHAYQQLNGGKHEPFYP